MLKRKIQAIVTYTMARKEATTFASAFDGGVFVDKVSVGVNLDKVIKRIRDHGGYDLEVEMVWNDKMVN